MNTKRTNFKVEKTYLRIETNRKSLEPVLNQKIINKVILKQSSVENFVFYQVNAIYAIETHGSILAVPHKDEVDQDIQEIKNVKLNIKIEGYLQNFLGINIDRRQDVSTHLAKPCMIDQILEDIKMRKTVNPISTPVPRP